MNVDCVVVDANIAFKALAAGQGDLRNRLGLSGTVIFFAPRFLFVELFRHKERLAQAAKRQDVASSECALNRCASAGLKRRRY